MFDDDQTTEELLGTVFGVTIARELMARYKTLGSLEDADPIELESIRGMGPIRASQLQAVLALAQRRATEAPYRGREVSCAEHVYQVLHPMVRHERRELLFVLALDSRNRLIRSPIEVARGGLSMTMIEPRDAVRPLIVAAAAGTVFAHNHPSGNAEPSDQDVYLTTTMAEVCAMVGIRFLDHVIIGDCDYVSLAERGVV